MKIKKERVDVLLVEQRISRNKRKSKAGHYGGLVYANEEGWKNQVKR